MNMFACNPPAKHLTRISFGCLENQKVNAGEYCETVGHFAVCHPKGEPSFTNLCFPILFREQGQNY